MFGVFNIWKNPLILNPVLSRAQKEIHKALLNNHKIHNNDTIYMKVQMEENSDLPQVYILCAEGKLYEHLTLSQLVKDPQLMKQLDALPGFVRKAINLDKIIDKLNRSISKYLGAKQYARVFSQNNDAVINVYNKANDELARSNVSLKELIEADNA